MDVVKGKEEKHEDDKTDNSDVFKFHINWIYNQYYKCSSCIKRRTWRKNFVANDAVKY